MPIESLWVHTETKNGIQRQSAFVKEIYELPAYVDVEMDCPEKDVSTFIARAGGMLTEKNNKLHAVALTKDIVYLEFQGMKGETTQIPLKQSEQKALVQKVSKEVKGFTALLNQASQREEEQIAAIEKEAEEFNLE